MEVMAEAGHSCSFKWLGWFGLARCTQTKREEGVGAFWDPSSWIHDASYREQNPSCKHPIKPFPFTLTFPGIIADITASDVLPP